MKGFHAPARAETPCWTKLAWNYKPLLVAKGFRVPGHDHGGSIQGNPADGVLGRKVWKPCRAMGVQCAERPSRLEASRETRPKVSLAGRTGNRARCWVPSAAPPCTNPERRRGRVCESGWAISDRRSLCPQPLCGCYSGVFDYRNPFRGMEMCKADG